MKLTTAIFIELKLISRFIKVLAIQMEIIFVVISTAVVVYVHEKLSVSIGSIVFCIIGIKLMSPQIAMLMTPP